MKRIQILFLICILGAGAKVFADDSWQAASSKMPLASPATELNRTNCVSLLLNSYQSNNVVKALIFMPGATDEIDFFRRVHVQLTNANPTLRDAIVALTNQTFIQATFEPPLLLLHTTEDSTNVIAIEKDKSTVAKLQKKNVPERILLDDADWSEVHSAVGSHLSVWLRPRANAPDSWHFYRHSFVACGVTDWQMLETLALAGKTTFTVHWLTVDFQADRREGVAPKVVQFPR